MGRGAGRTVGEEVRAVDLGVEVRDARRVGDGRHLKRRPTACRESVHSRQTSGGSRQKVTTHTVAGLMADCRSFHRLRDVVRVAAGDGGGLDLGAHHLVVEAE